MLYQHYIFISSSKWLKDIDFEEIDQYINSKIEEVNITRKTFIFIYNV